MADELLERRFLCGILGQQEACRAAPAEGVTHGDIIVLGCVPGAIDEGGPCDGLVGGVVPRCGHIANDRAVEVGGETEGERDGGRAEAIEDGRDKEWPACLDASGARAGQTRADGRLRGRVDLGPGKTRVGWGCRAKVVRKLHLRGRCGRAGVCSWLPREAALGRPTRFASLFAIKHVSARRCVPGDCPGTSGLSDCAARAPSNLIKFPSRPPPPPPARPA